MTGKQNFTPLIKENWWQDGTSIDGTTCLTRQVTLTPNEVNQLIVADLTYLFDLLQIGENDLDTDTDKLRDAIAVVLKEYMAPNDFDEWKALRGK